MATVYLSLFCVLDFFVRFFSSSLLLEFSLGHSVEVLEFSFRKSVLSCMGLSLALQL